MSGKISQVKLIYNRLLDGEAHNTRELSSLVMSKRLNPDEGGLVRLSERIREIKKQYGVEIVSFRDDQNHSKWYYQIKSMEHSKPNFEEMPEYEKYGEC
jgi:hypothetical protein